MPGTQVLLVKNTNKGGNSTGMVACPMSVVSDYGYTMPVVSDYNPMSVVSDYGYTMPVVSDYTTNKTNKPGAFYTLFYVNPRFNKILIINILYLKLQKLC